MALDKDKNLNDIITEMERSFKEFRVYGDERDFNLLKVKVTPEGNICQIPIKADFLYPESKYKDGSSILLSVENVKQALVQFVKYKYRNWTKIVSYDRIENKDTAPFDVSNSCAIPLSSYIEIINARRAGTKQAKEMSNRLKANTALIQQYKYGKITKTEYDKEWKRRNKEIEAKKSKFRSMEQLRNDYELLLQHIEKYVGKIEKSIHDQAFDLAPLSVHIIPKTHDGKGRALVTTGLSVLAMHPPPQLKEFKYSELIIRIPKDWPLPFKEIKNDEFLWPIQELLHLMRYIHSNQQWFFDMHTFGNGDPPLPYASNTNFCGFLFTLPLFSLPPKFCELKIDDSKTIIFLQLLPLYKEEMDYAITNTSEALLEKYEKLNLPDYIDLKRDSAVGSSNFIPGIAKTKGMWCPICSNTIRDFKPGGYRCPMCKHILIQDHTGVLRAHDIPEEKTPISNKVKMKAEKLFFEGLSYLDKKMPEKAIEILTKAFELNPYDRRVWSLKSTILYDLGRQKEAYECGMEGLKYT